MAEARDTVKETGGAGRDIFAVSAFSDGYSTVTEIMDFHKGEDKLWIDNEAGYQNRVIWQNLDRSCDGVINGTDALYGAPVVSKPEGNSITFADGDDWVVLHGASQINTSDWLFS